MTDPPADPPVRPPRNPGHVQRYGWSPWLAPLTFYVFGWVAIGVVLHYSHLAGALLVAPLTIGCLLFWEHQRNLICPHCGLRAVACRCCG